MEHESDGSKCRDEIVARGLRIRARRWRPMDRNPSILRRRTVQIAGSVCAVLLMIVPTYLSDPQPPPHSSSKFSPFASPDSGPIGDFPGFLPPAQFPSPDNLTDPGSYNYLRFATGVVGTTPAFWVLYVKTSSTGRYLLEFQTGFYNPTQAWQITSHLTCSTPGATCWHHSISWSPARVLVNSSAPISGDALGATSTVVALAYVISGIVTMRSSNDGGTTWGTVASASGSNPEITSSSSYVMYLYTQSGHVVVTSISLVCGSSSVSTTGSLVAQNATPLILPNGGLAVVTSSASSHLVQLVPLTSARTAFQSGVTVGSWTPNSTSSIFTRIGATALATPGGLPGQVAAAVAGPVVMALFSTSVNGQVQAATSISRDSGAHWQGPYIVGPSMGAIQDPQLLVLPAGQFLGAWRASDNGSWELQETLFAADGRAILGPVPVPASGGLSSLVALSVTALVDAWGRPFLAWLARTPTGVQVLFDGGDISAANLVSDWIKEVQSLHSLDFLPGKSSSKNTLLAQLNQVKGFLLSSSYSSAATTIESSIFPEIGSTTLVLDCDAAVTLPACASLNPIGTSIALAPASGPFSPRTYLINYLAETLEALGVEVRLPVGQASFMFGSTCSSGQQMMILAPGPSGGAPSPPTGGASVSWFVNSSASGFKLQAMSQILNPKAANLSVGWQVPSNASTKSWVSHNLGSSCGDPNGCYVTACNTTTLLSSTLLVKLSSSFQGSGTSKTFNLSSNTTVLRLTNLTYNGATYWGITLTAHMRTNQSFVQGRSCDGSVPGTTKSYSNVTLPAGWGVAWTTLNVTTPNPNVMSSTSAWTNWSTNQPTKGWRNYTNGNPHPTNWADPVFGRTHSNLSTGLGNGWYNLTEASRTQQAGAPGSPPPAYASFGNTVNNGNSRWSSSTKTICGLTANPLTVMWVSFNNITVSNVTVSFSTNFPVTSIVKLVQMGPGQVLQFAGIVSTAAGNGTHKSLAELHDLVPWATYNVTIASTMTRCGLDYTRSSSGFQFATPANFYTWESDYPYDSISQAGGGALVDWYVPASTLTYYSFKDGTVSYWPTTNISAKVVSRVTSPSPWGYLTIGGVNITPSLSNTQYSFVAQMNFSLRSNPSVVYTATSYPCNFTYLKDSSGDGLTDNEKTRGWSITTSGNSGDFSTRWSWANPSLYATNDLVSDFVEKEYGLDPNTVDSAGSHMLDTWNLTFNLGLSATNPTAPVGANFHYWGGNSTYDPFTACPFPKPPPCQGFIQGANLTNLTSSAPGVLHGDSSPWAAEVLWARSQLIAFDNLSGVKSAGWLRAVFGTHNGVRTLTVWGKLSWGANPLASSTPLNGIPDGFRVTPLGMTALQISVLNWTATGLTSGDGVAAYERSWSAAAPYYSARTDYSGYTKQQLADGGGTSSFSGIFTTTFAITPTEQLASLNLSLIQNHNGFSAAVNSPNMSIDLLDSSLHLGYSTSGSDRLGFDYIVMSILSKAPTYVYVEAGNYSLSPLPAGLQRYSGGQNFVLLVVNDTINGSGSLGVGSVPYVELNGTTSSATYTVTMSGGLNNILVPRSVFLRSPLGQSMVNGTNVSIQNRASNTFLQSHWDPQTWYARATGMVSWNNSDYSPGKTGFVKVYSNNSQNCTSNPLLCVGVPSSSNLEQGAASLSLSAIVPLNTTNLPQLMGLLAGLLLNRSGNFTGWLYGAQNYVGSLGLATGLVKALANFSVENDGAFGAPAGTQTPPPSWNGISAGTIWNAWTGAVGSLSVVWTPGIAGVAYGWKIGPLTSGWQIGPIPDVPSGLKSVARGMWWNDNMLAQSLIVYGAITIKPGWDLVKATLQARAYNVLQSTNQLTSAIVNASLNPTPLNNGRVHSAGINFSLSLLPNDPVSVGLRVAIDVVSTAFLPLESVISTNQVVADIWVVVSGGSGLPAAFIRALPGGSAFGSGITSALAGYYSMCGLGGAANTSAFTSAAWTLMNHTASSAAYLNSFPNFPVDVGTYLSNFWGQIQPPMTYVDLVLTFMAAEAFGVQFAVGAASIFSVLDLSALLLTVAGFALYLYPPEFWANIASIATDSISTLIDVAVFLSVQAKVKAKTALPQAARLEAVVDGIDMVANFYDIKISADAL